MGGAEQGWCQRCDNLVHSSGEPMWKDLAGESFHMSQESIEQGYKLWNLVLSWPHALQHGIIGPSKELDFDSDSCEAVGVLKW